MFMILISIVVIIYLIYLFLTWNFDYWKKRNIPHEKPTVGFGNMKDALLMKKSQQALQMDIYKKFRDYKYVGFYNMRQPVLFVRDLELIRTILIKDFSSFNSNGFQLDEKNDPFMTKNPFILEGEKWKQVRTKVSPALSSGRMKMMFPQMVKVGERLIEFIENNQDNVAGKGLYTKELFSKYTVDSVAYCALSLDVKSFENPNSEFRKMGSKIFNTDDYWITLKFFLFAMSPTIANFFGFSFVPKDVGNYFVRFIREQIDYRKKHNLVYNDFMDFMIELQQKCKEFEFTDTYIAAQLIAFFSDGFETSSIAMGYVMYEIAAHAHVQNRLRNEIEEVIEKYDGKITYEGVMQDMKYLDCVVNETLRLRTPAVSSQKRCTAPYTLPPAKDGMPELKIEPGLQVTIPIYCIMRDPEFFPNPDTFDPDRFNDERKKDIVKNSYLPFGEGPRQCIGMRFALTQIKVGVVTLLRNYEIRVHNRTKVPLQDDPSSFITKPLGGIWLTFHKIK